VLTPSAAYLKMTWALSDIMAPANGRTCSAWWLAGSVKPGSAKENRRHQQAGMGGENAAALAAEDNGGSRGVK